MVMMKSGVYQIRNLINNKVYVGSTEEFLGRWRNHRYDLITLSHQHHSAHLQHAWDKYGEGNFFFGVLQECEIEDLVFYEQLWMDCFRSYDPRFGYNICRVAGRTTGVKHSEETKKKMSESHRDVNGERNPAAKLTQSLAFRIREDYLTGDYFQAELAQKYQVRQPTVSAIILNKTWADESLGSDYFQKVLEIKRITYAELQSGKKASEETKKKMSAEYNGNHKLTWAQVREIRAKYSFRCYPLNKLAEEYGVTRSSIFSILHNKTWKEL